jgi:hypothetical protein
VEPDLEILSATIQAHAREQAHKEWAGEHRAVLMQILVCAGLAKEKSNDLHTFEATLNIDGREIPIEAIVKALHEHFLARRTSALTQKIADQVVRTAARKVVDEEDAENDKNL